MSQYVYWHAPLWEVLLLVLISLMFLTWLVVRALRRPNLPAALSAVNPALNDHPLFFFDRMTGVTCLNEAAQQTLDNLPASQRQHMLDALMDTLLEAYEESRVAQQQGWPDPDCILVAAPFARQPGDVTGVLAVVTTEWLPPPLADRVADEPPTREANGWLTLGPALRVHRTRPLVHVWRADPTQDARPSWQEYQLSHAEETLLRYLLEHEGEVQPSETLFQVVWPDDEVDEFGLRPDQKDRLRRLVYQLRQHMEPEPRNPRYVCTAHGVGYVLYTEEELIE